jgi:tetratricopeptide (TPR) repeat protein
VQGWFDKAEMAARKAIALDGRYAGGYGALAATQLLRGKWAEADELFMQAFALDADDAEVVSRNGGLVVATGHIKQGVGLRQRLLTLEPTDPAFKIYSALVMLYDGQTEAAISLLEPLSSLPGRNRALAKAYAAAGRYGDSADTLLLPTAADFFRVAQSRTRRGLCAPLPQNRAHLKACRPSKVSSALSMPMWVLFLASWKISITSSTLDIWGTPGSCGLPNWRQCAKRTASRR